MLTSFWSTSTASSAASTANTAASAATSVSTDAFANWPTATQVNYVKVNGAGNPPSLLLTGKDGKSQSLASLSSGGLGVSLVPVPSDFSKKPGDLTLTGFQAWDDNVQLAYIRSQGTGTPKSVQIGPAASAVVATLTGDESAITLKASSSLAATDSSKIHSWSNDTQLSAAEFFALQPDEQQSYFDDAYQKAFVAWQASLNVFQPVPLSTAASLLHSSQLLAFSDSDKDHAIANQVTLNINGRSINVSLPASYLGAMTSVSIQNNRPYSPPLIGVEPSTFSGWPKEVQTAYVNQFTSQATLPSATYPKVAVLVGTGSSTTVTIPAAGAQPVLTPNPSDFAGILGSNNLPALGTFLSWPPATQLAYARSKNTALTLTDGASTVTVTPNTDRSDISIDLNVDMSGATAPSIDLNLFLNLVSPSVQANFLAKYGTGTPKILTSGSGADTTVVSGATATSGGALTVEKVGSDFAKTPDALLPVTFMSWSAAVRQAYVAVNLKTPSGTLAIGDPKTTNTVTASYSSTGVLQIVTAGALIVAGQVDAQVPLPYAALQGSQVGTSSAINQATATALFPLLQGDPTQAGSTVVPLPDTFSKAPDQLDAGEFGSWNTAVQLQYLRANLGTASSLTIGIKGSTNGTLDAFISAPTTPQLTVQKVYIVQNLQKQDIAKMSLADQTTLAGISAFQVIAYSLGLVPDGDKATTPAQARTIIDAQVSDALGIIADPTKGTPSMADGYMPAADKQVFIDQINIIKTQLAGSAIFSPKDVQDKLTAITTRFSRAYAFAVPLSAVPSDTNGQYTIENATGIEYVNSAGFKDRSDAPTVYLNQGGTGYRDSVQSGFNGYWLDRNRNNFNDLMMSLDIPGNVPSTPPDNSVILIPTSRTLSKNGGTLALDGITVQLDQEFSQYQGSSTNLYSPDPDIKENGTIAGIGSQHYVYPVLIGGKYYYYRIIEASGKESTGNYDRFFDSNGNITQSDPGKADGEYIFPVYDSDKKGMLTTFFSGKSQNYIIDQVRNRIPNLDSILADGKPHTFTGLSIANTSNDTLPDRQGSGAATAAYINSITLTWKPPASPSLDNNATIRSGYQVFMAQEKAVLEQANRAQLLATTGKLTSQNLDVPNLVFLFQLYANLTGEAILRSDTEEVNQTNALLKTYSVMQRIINQTVGKIGSSTDGHVLVGSANTNGDFTDEEKLALKLFSNTGSVPTPHPIEVLKGITRHVFNTDTGNSQNGPTWSQDGTALSDQVTLLNQDSQLKMNDINSATKQKDRNFDLANNALSKMSDVIQKIANSIS